MSQSVEKIAVPPMDDHNKALVANVRPPDWTNPAPAPRYNLVVLGAGTAGLVAAAGAAGLGAKVALVERNLLGGDCLNVGCVPSKCVIRSSRAVADVRDAGLFGVTPSPALTPKGSPAGDQAGDGVNGPSHEVSVDFGAVMERMRRLRAGLSRHDSAARFRDLGVDVFLGDARFTGPDTLEAAGKSLRFKKAVIATGARAVQPPVPGLAEAGFLTNETVFTLTERPRRLAVVGGGPLGCELAQAFRRLGSDVTLLHKHARLLDREDADAAEIVRKTFAREGIRVVLGAEITRVEKSSEAKTLRFRADGKEDEALVDEILVSAGRAPNVEGLGLEAAGVKHDPREGVIVNDHLQTTNPRIYAAGDVCMKWKFTHAADAAARLVVQNALFFGSKRLSDLTMPWTTYTDPEVAHVGMSERDAKAAGIELDTFTREMKDVDRAVVDGETEGFVKVRVRKGTGRILGATVVARHAGEMIGELTLAIVAGVGLGALGGVIHPYPTQAEAIKQAGDAYNRTRLTPAVKRLLSKFLALTR